MYLSVQSHKFDLIQSRERKKAAILFIMLHVFMAKQVISNCTFNYREFICDLSELRPQEKIF